MNLERLSMISKRASLLDGCASTIINYWGKSFEVAEGLMYLNKYQLRKLMQWDAITYAIIHIVTTMKGTVYGGMIASHYSGFVTNDIDIMFPNCEAITTFKKVFLERLCFLFGFSHSQIQFEYLASPGYGHKHILTIQCVGPEKKTLEILMDISHNTIMEIRKRQFIPITWGRCLAYNLTKGIHLRLTCDFAMDCHVPIHRVLKCLYEGTDIWMVIDSPSNRYNKETQVVYKKYLQDRERIIVEQGYDMPPLKCIFLT